MKKLVIRIAVVAVVALFCMGGCGKDGPESRPFGCDGYQYRGVLITYYVTAPLGEVWVSFWFLSNSDSENLLQIRDWLFESGWIAFVSRQYPNEEIIACRKDIHDTKSVQMNLRTLLPKLDDYMQSIRKGQQK